MFAKPYRLKSNNTLKNTEKKHLSQKIAAEFPSVSGEKIKELVPTKSNCICMKLILNSEETVNVYSVDGTPMLIETSERFVPTVCALWKVPELVPHITIASPVLSKIQNGAPLYLPGVLLPSQGIGFPQFKKDAVIAAQTTDNASAVIVGRSLMSSGDMLLRAAGVCMETMHVIGDQLCKDAKFNKMERPKLGPPSYDISGIAQSLAVNLNQLSLNPSEKEEWPALGKQTTKPVSAPVPNEPQIIPEAELEEKQECVNVESNEAVVSSDAESESDSADSIPQDMDGLLRWCLLGFLRDSSSVQLPLLTSLLYRNYLIPLCPEDRTLDVKKSTYKKIGKFLEAMEKEGLVEMRELDKGVLGLTALNARHPAVRAHRPPSGARPGHAPTASHEYRPPAVREVFCVTAAVALLFPEHKKGTPLSAQEVRATLTEHIRRQTARDVTASDIPPRAASRDVTLDAILARALGRQEQERVRWDELMLGIQKKMTASTEMQFADGTTKLIKTKIEPITMQVVNRSGNKKVTLVSNLEEYGFSLAELSTVCQHGVAASCGITRSPGAKRDQLMLQGDQTHYVAKLLIEKYGLPKKFVEGADKALNKKK